MNIIVLACAIRSGGALTIYRQFLSYLPNFVQDNHFYLFVASEADHPVIDGVTYIIENNHSFKRRFWYDQIGLRQWLKKHNVKPDVLVSFQNMGARIDCPQLIYYHQSLPFYSKKWNPFKRSERIMFFYKHIYPCFVRLYLRQDTHVVVQIPFIKDGFLKKFSKVPFHNVHVLFPDLEKIDIKHIPDFNFDKESIHILYPAIAAPYKEHRILVKALSLLKKKNPKLVKKIKIHFTIQSKEDKDLYSLVKDNKLEDNFIFNGKIQHGDLLSMYKSSDLLLFPSTIETLGLPLLEAATFGLPIVASDLEYAHDVLKNYEGVSFVSVRDYQAWSEVIEEHCLNRKKYKPITLPNSSWPEFYKLIEKIGNKSNI